MSTTAASTAAGATETSPHFSLAAGESTAPPTATAPRVWSANLPNGLPNTKKFSEEDPEGVNEEANKKKKKKRNKNKKKTAAEASGPKGEGDNTESTAREGAPREDFTPLKEKIGQSFFEDQDSSEDEGMPDYKIGGYHPVHVGEILLDRYVIIQKLGWGHFSTVWLTKDLKYNSYVAMKVQKSAQHYLEAAYDEVEILDQVATNWKSDEWRRSVERVYKDDP